MTRAGLSQIKAAVPATEKAIDAVLTLGFGPDVLTHNEVSAALRKGD